MTGFRRAFWLGGGLVLGGLAFTAALGLAGCTPRQAPPALATGERPVTGVPRFDRVFADINAAFVAVQDARAEEAEARGAVSHRVGLQDGVPLDVLGARLRERTARLAQDGLTLQLEFAGIDEADGDSHGDGDGDGAAGETGDGREAGGTDTGGTEAADANAASPTATLRTPGREPEPRELRLLEALAQAALSGATVYANMGHVKHRTERLLVEVAELSGQVDTSFADIDSRERTLVKLNEARAFLPQLGAQAHEVAGSADALISLLDEAANTLPVAPLKKRPVPAPKPIAPAQPQVLPAGRPPAPPPVATPPAAAPPAPPPASAPPASASPATATP